MDPQYQDSVHCCSFVVVAVQSEETESWSTESITEESGIHALQLASFATNPDKK
jgi:hypothetical protein